MIARLQVEDLERRMILGTYVPFDPGKPTAAYWLCLSCTTSPGCKARVEDVLRERFGCDCRSPPGL